MGARQFCTQTATTKRAEDLSNGIKGAPVDYLTDLAVTPVWSLRPETAQTLGISSPREYKELYHVPLEGEELPDIREGDLLITNGVTYVVDTVAEWPDAAIPTLVIVIGDVKREWAGA